MQYVETLTASGETVTLAFHLHCLAGYGWTLKRQARGAMHEARVRYLAIVENEQARAGLSDAEYAALDARTTIRSPRS